MKYHLFATIFCCSILNSIAQQQLVICHESGEDNDIVSAYSSQSFRISGYDEDNSSALWQIKFQLSSGDYQLYAQASSSLLFNIPQIVDIVDYKISDDGLLSGVITFSCTIDNHIITAERNIYYDFKPVFTSVELSEPQIVSEDYYNLPLTLQYSGADKVKVEVEQDFSPSIITDFLNNSSPINYTVEHINSHYSCWIDITLTNQYGSAKYTIEQKPLNQNSGSVNTVIIKDNDMMFDIYTLSGIRIGNSLSYSQIDELPAGVYIVQCKKAGAIVGHKKISVK